jgi:hypothetical protein
MQKNSLSSTNASAKWESALVKKTIHLIYNHPVEGLKMHKSVQICTYSLSVLNSICGFDPSSIKSRSCEYKAYTRIERDNDHEAIPFISIIVRKI